MKRAVIICAIAALLPGCAAGSDSEFGVSPAVVRKALTPDLIVTENEHVVKGDERLVVVVGENHASVKTQIQLAHLTARLLDRNLVEAILLEGSNGPFDISRFVRDLEKLSTSGTKLAAFWWQQLECGRVAGYEYVALTRPGLEIAGVEDMGAKARYEVGLQTRAFREVVASCERAAAALDRDLDSLCHKANANDIQHVRSILDEFKAARSRFAHIPEEVARKLEPLGPPQAEMMELQRLLLSLYERLNSLTPSYDDYEQWSEEARPLYQRLKPVLDKMDNSSTIEESDLSSTQKRDLQKLNQLAEKLSVFRRVHQDDLDQLEELGSKFSALSKRLEEAQKSLEPFLEKVEAANTELEDALFVAANALQSLAATLGAPRPKSMEFFHEESELQRKENTTREKPFMAERDRAMVASTVRFLQQRTKQRVLLIVGYAHLPGIIENLAANNVSFISGRLKASEEEIEPWEVEAWNVRKRANVPVFSALKQQIKEESPLRSALWRKEQLARLEYFRRIHEPVSPLKPTVSGLAGDSKILETVGNKDRVVMIGRFPFDRNADFGTHVSDQGPVPEKPGEFYRVFDRGRVDNLINELSDATANFVYHYKTLSSQGSTATYRLKTAGGEKSLGEFMESPPSKAKYEVLFGEPDEVEEGGLLVSPLQRELRRGGTPPPGGSPPWTSAFADPGDPRRPILLRTINAQRARRNLVALEKQQTSRLGDVSFFEDADMPALSDRLLFTPSRGDYAQMVVLTAKNTAEFRLSIRKAADAKLLKGKQVALITCGDAFADTAALREDLLRAGALMVWVNDRQITPEAARRLRDQVKKTVDSLPPEQRKTIDQLMNHSLQKWRKADPGSPDHRTFLRAGSFVHAQHCGHFSRFQS